MPPFPDSYVIPTPSHVPAELNKLNKEFQGEVRKGAFDFERARAVLKDLGE